MDEEVNLERGIFAKIPSEMKLNLDVKLTQEQLTLRSWIMCCIKTYLEETPQPTEWVYTEAD